MQKFESSFLAFKALKKFGAEKQIIKLGEEFGEVCNAFLKKDNENLTEELIDLQIVLESLFWYVESTNEELERIYKYKLKKLESHVNS